MYISTHVWADREIVAAVHFHCVSGGGHPKPAITTARTPTDPFRRITRPSCVCAPFPRVSVCKLYHNIMCRKVYAFIVRYDLLLGQLFSGVHVRVLWLMERAFQILQLLARERGSASALFAFQMKPRFGFRVRIVGATGTFKREKKTVYQKFVLKPRDCIPIIHTHTLIHMPTTTTTAHWQDIYCPAILYTIRVRIIM